MINIKTKIKDNSVILFQGDSITDCLRTYDGDFGSGMVQKTEIGYGYPYMVKNYVDTFFPESGIKIYNRGISGNTSTDLVNRWKEDCLDLKPDYLSILIGINDVSRRYNEGDTKITTLLEYENNLRLIIDQTKKVNEECSIILLEPFLIPCSKERDRFREDLDLKIQVLRKISREHNAIYIPLDGIFSSICTNIELAKELSHDCIHLSKKGHSILARSWIDEVV